jgi:hypothetical protein
MKYKKALCLLTLLLYFVDARSQEVYFEYSGHTFGESTKDSKEVFTLMAQTNPPNLYGFPQGLTPALLLGDEKKESCNLTKSGIRCSASSTEATSVYSLSRFTGLFKISTMYSGPQESAINTVMNCKRIDMKKKIL